MAIRLNNLAQLLQATNRLAEAEPLMRRALAIDEKSYGPDHPKVATTSTISRMLLQATNRLAEAEPLMRRALAIFETSLGPDHPNTVTARNNLAALEAALARAAGERWFIHRPHPEEPAQRASRRMIQLALALVRCRRSLETRLSALLRTRSRGSRMTMRARP